VTLGGVVLDEGIKSETHMRKNITERCEDEHREFVFIGVKTINEMANPHLHHRCVILPALLYAFDCEPGFFEEYLKTKVGIAEIVMGNFVELVHLGNCEENVPSAFEDPMHFFECGSRVGDVFEDLGAENGIERVIREGNLFRGSHDIGVTCCTCIQSFIVSNGFEEGSISS
jgi:hypothetical protein